MFAIVHKILPSRIRRKPLLILILCVLLFTILHLTGITESSTITLKDGEVIPCDEETQSVENTYLESNNGLYSRIFDLIAAAKPKCHPLLRYKKENEDIQRFSKHGVKFSKKFLSSLLKITPFQKLKLFESYETFISSYENLNLQVFGDNESRKISGKGIVIVGGGKFSWLALINITQLRQTGSNLPVEIYIPSLKDYDEVFCNSILPELNAKCVTGYKDLPLSRYKKELNLHKYEHKVMAILASSFEDILMLDADNFVVSAPDGLFNWDIYKQYQLVLWPDAWIRTTNPFLYELFHINIDTDFIPESGEYDLHDLPGAIPNPSSESGMLLVNKRMHVDTLMLSLYINTYGHDYYYPLLTQGGAGEGDKDSFIIAAYALKKPVYQVRQETQFLGYYEGEHYYSFGLGQCDPTTKDERQAHIDNVREVFCPKFAFVHLSNPKYYPKDMTEIAYDDNGNDLVLLRNLNVGYNLELQIWEIVCQLLCRYYKENKIHPGEPASSLINPKMRQTGKKLACLSGVPIEKMCGSKLLPHLEFLREYFKQK